MTTLELCKYALEKAGIPRRVEEILNILKQSGMWDKPTNTPEASIASELSKDVQKKNSVFVKFGKNCYGLKIHKAPIGQKGYVYILFNPAFPDYVKVGKAASVAERLITLNQAVPLMFEPKYVLASTAYENAEGQVHSNLYAKGYHHDGDNKEFFRCSVKDALHEMRKVAKILSEGDNEVLAWSLEVESRFKTLKAKVAKRYVDEFCKGVLSVEGASHAVSASLFVKFSNGKIINEGSSADTFAKTIALLGPAKVADLHLCRDKVELVSKDESIFPYRAAVRDVGGGWFVNTHASVSDNKKKLEVIIHELKVDATVSS